MRPTDVTGSNPTGMRISVLVFTRDLRIHDNPALAAATARSERVLPLYVLDDGLSLYPVSGGRGNRDRFLLESLRDLERSLRELGGRLVVRTGAWVDEVLRAVAQVGAGEVHLAEDVDARSRQRAACLTREAARLRAKVFVHPGITIVPAGQVSPAGGGEYKVFGAYRRAWAATGWRTMAARPATLRLPDMVTGGGLDGAIGDAGGAPQRAVVGGESAGRARLRAWSEANLERYSEARDDLAADATSRISAYLAFGCLSAREVAAELTGRPGGDDFVRQLCWRDFFYQVLAARPDAESADYRDRGDVWRVDDEAFELWRSGRTGFPVVDAGMRQLAAEGFMHNRARMITASFLTKDLGLDWRQGAAHFGSLLLDADLANNQLNWQWVAGTGTDRNPNRIFNPTVQSRRFDPDGRYVRRYVPELAEVDGRAIHDPDAATRRRLGYPDPIVDHRLAVAAYRASLRR